MASRHFIVFERGVFRVNIHDDSVHISLRAYHNNILLSQRSKIEWISLNITPESNNCVVLPIIKLYLR